MLINQSRISELQRCPRRYAWRYRVNLEPRIPSLRLHIGTAVHAGLAAFYRSARNTEAAISAYKASMAAFPVSDVNRVDYEAALPLWEKRLVFYGQHHVNEDFKVRMVPEQEMLVPIGRHRMAVRVDLIIERADGTVWVMDHKTADRTGPSYWPKFFVDLQGTSYLYAVKMAIGITPVGWIINVLKSTKEGWYERETFTRSAQQLESWQRQVEVQLTALEEKHALDGNGAEESLDAIYPQYTHDCHSWGRMCAFLALCQAGLKAGRAAFVDRVPDYVDTGSGAAPGGSGDAHNLVGKVEGVKRETRT